MRTRPSHVLPAATVLLAIALALVPASAGCGGDDESAQTTPELPRLTTPQTESAVPQPPETETAAPLDPGTETLPPDGDGDSSDDGGTPAPAPEAEPPADTPENDTPPPADSPAERFEKFCEENPGACG